MKFFKLGAYLTWIVCIAFVCGGIAAHPEAETAEGTAVSGDAPETEPEVFAEPADTPTDDLAPAETSVDLDWLFGSFEATLESELQSAGDSDIFTPQTGWYKICVPDFCQPCTTDADCFGSNRCRAQLCP